MVDLHRSSVLADRDICSFHYVVLFRRERDHWGDPGVDGWIILGWISKRWNVGIWTGLGWSRIETRGVRL